MIQNVNIRNIGTMRKLPPKVTEELIKALTAKFSNFPAYGCAYELRDFKIVFPMQFCPVEYCTCDWGLATDVDTDEPLALIPDVAPGFTYDMRTAFRAAAPAPIVFVHGNTVYYPEHHYSYDLGSWFPFENDTTYTIDN